MTILLFLSPIISYYITTIRDNAVKGKIWHVVALPLLFQLSFCLHMFLSKQAYMKILSLYISKFGLTNKNTSPILKLI